MAKILIVEDDPKLRTVFELIVKKAGHDVTTANDGHDALAKVENQDFELILLDIMMPHKDGLGFLKDYHQKYGKPKTKIIVFSNMERTDHLDEAYKLGASRYMLKAATTPKELISVIDHELDASNIPT